MNRLNTLMATITAKQEAKVQVKETNLTKNRIAFQRRMLIASDQPVAPDVAYTIQAELMQLGYTLSEEALGHVTIDWYVDVIDFIKKSLGVGKYRPIYENFPNEVMNTELFQLYRNAVRHYWSNGTWEPTQELQDRGIAFEQTEFTTIELATEEDFKNIFTRLVSINQSITENDKNILQWFVDNYGVTNLTLPVTIPFKETLCMLAAYGFDVPVKTATDVLRIAVYFSGGDISMPALPKLTIQEVKDGRRKRFFEVKKEHQIQEREKFNFLKFSRSERKYLLGLLEKTNLDLGEMKLKLGRWLRLGEILHPMEYKNKFPRTASTFEVLRNASKDIVTFNGMVDAAFKENQLKGIQVLSQRPGEYARRLDWMLRTFETTPVLDTFTAISSKVSRKVLWELYNHFLNRDRENAARSVMIKGNRSVKKALTPLPVLDSELIANVQGTILNCISNQFKTLEGLGTVWIDERLRNIPLPSAMRSVNTSVKTYVRGTRIPFSENAKVVRPYIHWFDERGNEDLDLSVGFYDSTLKSIDHVSFTHLKSEMLNSCHSGDVRHRRGACAEYVDIDVNACLFHNVRYAIVQVNNFQGRPMHTMKDCVFGLMEREFPESNPIFVPKTITNAMGLANESPTVNVCILDLVMKEYIWCDLEVAGSIPVLEHNSKSTGHIIHSLIMNDKLSVYDLLTLHGRSRGVVVYSPEQSTTQFKYEDYITSYDKIAELM